ncbi:MAG: 3D domain-containing protein [Thermoleophilia bacterium]|nr:3D domain-containing protein [Thermoleophilia bacterium]
MQEAATTLRALSVPVCVALVLAVTLPAADGARRDSERARVEARAAPPAAAELVPLDQRLARVRATLASLSARSAALERQRGELRLQAGITVRSLALAERRLARRMRALYEAGDPRPLDVVLGAESLDDALARLDSLERAAEQDAYLIRHARALHSGLAHMRRTLDERRLALDHLEASTRATLRALERIQAVHAAHARGRRYAAGPTSKPARASTSSPSVPALAAPAVAPSGERRLTVVATAYALRGATATGSPVGYGTVAVDPAVIPLGSRLSIPGYGEGVAADTGPEVRGARIDVWVQTVQQALAWGTRTVTVTIHAP